MHPPARCVILLPPCSRRAKMAVMNEFAAALFLLGAAFWLTWIVRLFSARISLRYHFLGSAAVTVAFAIPLTEQAPLAAVLAAVVLGFALLCLPGFILSRRARRQAMRRDIEAMARSQAIEPWHGQARPHSPEPPSHDAAHAVRLHINEVAHLSREATEAHAPRRVMTQIDQQLAGILRLATAHPSLKDDPFLIRELYGCAQLLARFGFDDPLLVQRFHSLLGPTMPLEWSDHPLSRVGYQPAPPGQQGQKAPPPDHPPAPPPGSAPDEVEDEQEDAADVPPYKTAPQEEPPAAPEPPPEAPKRRGRRHTTSAKAEPPPETDDPPPRQRRRRTSGAPEEPADPPPDPHSQEAETAAARAEKPDPLDELLDKLANTSDDR